MKIKRSGSRPSAKGPAEWFTGTVRIDPLFRANALARGVGNAVTFEPSARTAWHTHPFGSGSSSARLRTSMFCAPPLLPSNTAALRFYPRSAARFIGEPLNAALNCCRDIANNSRASVRASLPARILRTANAGSLSSGVNYTFHGHTSWEMYRQNRFEIALRTGARSLRNQRS